MLVSKEQTSKTGIVITLSGILLYTSPIWFENSLKRKSIKGIIGQELTIRSLSLYKIIFEYSFVFIISSMYVLFHYLLNRS